MHQHLTDLILFLNNYFKIKQGHKNVDTFRSSMARRRRNWRKCKITTPGSLNRSRSWSFRPSSRSSESRRRASRTIRQTSGMIWRRDTPRRLGNCLVPRLQLTPGPVWPISGVIRVIRGQEAVIRALGTVPGHPTPAPMPPHPPGRDRPRTPGHLQMETRRRRRGVRWQITGTPRVIMFSLSIQNVFYCCFSIPNQSVDTSSCAEPWWFSIFEFFKNSNRRLWFV